MRLTAILAFMALLLGVISCNTTPVYQPLTGVDNIRPINLIDTYRIGVDDQVSISVWQNPDLSVSVPVRPDGKISMPLIGDIMAGGQTPEEVSRDITMQLTAFIREPQVTVILTGLNSHEFISRIRITGAVGDPISLPYRQGMTVLDALLEAGGLNEFAHGNAAILVREYEDRVKSYPLFLSDMWRNGDIRTNYLLAPGDVITVPERLF